MKIRILFILVFLSGNLLAQNDTAAIRKADSLFKAKKYDDALAIYSKLIKQNPKNDKALKGRGDVFLMQEKLKPAEQDFLQVIQLTKKCIDCYVSLANIRRVQMDTAAANKFIAEAFKIDSNNRRVFLSRGRIRFAEEKFDLALADYEKAIRLDSSYAAAYFYKGMLHFQLGEYDKGFNDMNSSIRLDTTIASSWFQRGNYYANNQQWDAALNDFKKAFALDSLNSNYVMNIGAVHLYKNDPAAAYDHYSAAVKLDEKNYEAHYYRSVAAYRMEDMDLSCSCLKTMRSKLPAKTNDEQILDWQNQMNGHLKEYCDTGFSGYYYQRGIAAYNKGRFEESLQWYDSGLKKYPRHFMMTNFRGNTKLALGMNKEAEEDYTASLGLIDNIDKELNEASSYRDESAEAQKMYKASVIAFTYCSRAEVRTNMNDLKAAESDAETALKMMPAEMPEKETVYNTRGILYLLDNDNSNALNYFNKAIQANPQFIPAYINRSLVKINLAYKTRIITSRFSIQNKSISTMLDLPALKKTIVKKENLEAALADCNKIIQVDPQTANAYHLRAVIKILLGEGDYCYDLFKAEQLGSQEAAAMIIDYKCR